MRERLRVIAPYAIVLVLAGALYLVATRFEYTPHAGRLGPEIWPRAILVLIAGVCVFRILTALRAPRDEGPGGGVLQDVLAERAAAQATPNPRRTRDSPACSRSASRSPSLTCGCSACSGSRWRARSISVR